MLRSWGKEAPMIRKLNLFTPTSLWDVGIVVAILVACVVAVGVVLAPVETRTGLADSADLWKLYSEGQNPWARPFFPDETPPYAGAQVRTAATQPRSKPRSF
jgi:hypothetical protein